MNVNTKAAYHKLELALVVRNERHRVKKRKGNS